MYEEQMQKIKAVIREEIELSYYDEVGEGKKQFRVEKIDGKTVPEDIVIIVDLRNTFGIGMTHGRPIFPVDFSNVYGLLEVYVCEKKKGLFGKTKLKTLNMVSQMFHLSGLESGEEVPVSLKEVLNTQ